jgi:hypothetical protein
LDSFQLVSEQANPVPCLYSWFSLYITADLNNRTLSSFIQFARGHCINMASNMAAILVLFYWIVMIQLIDCKATIFWQEYLYAEFSISGFHVRSWWWENNKKYPQNILSLINIGTLKLSISMMLMTSHEN